ncbi:MAG: DUF4363 family protein [Clostridia bacterium]|nr:DUF4363 family protein [Clostridia bacterium]
MKRLIPAGILLALIAVMCAVSSTTALKSIKSAKGEIEKCRLLYSEGRYTEAEKCAESFKESWIKTSEKISAYTNHCPLEDITCLAEELQTAAQLKDGYQFASAINRIKAKLRLIKKEQSFALENFY